MFGYCENTLVERIRIIETDKYKVFIIVTPFEKEKIFTN
jgi:hypothetical protein